MRGRGYVGQFSRNSMGRDRHSNPRYPRSTLSGSCSLFKQASNSILGSYPFSLTLTPFPLCHSLRILSSLSRAFSRFPDLSFSLSVFLRLSHIASRLSLPVRPSPPSFEAHPTQIRERYSGISAVAITTWISPVLQAVTAQSFHCNYLLVNVPRRPTSPRGLASNNNSVLFPYVSRRCESRELQARHLVYGLRPAEKPPAWLSDVP